MSEWLFLLLPVSAASGGYAAWRYFKKYYLVDRVQELREAYCRGIGHFLDERPEKAIHAFADLMASDAETIETHLALGNLFRRKGDLEKAIEIHESLINRNDLTRVHAAAAQFELATDYLRSGLLDRAESLFSNLTGDEHYRKRALEQLLHIFQHEKEWLKAIECASVLERMGRLPHALTISQLYCELADQALSAGCEERALALLNEALEKDRCCVRATLSTARLQMRSGHFDAALQTLKTVESQNPAFLSEIIEPLILCNEQLATPVGQVVGYFGYLYGTYGLESAGLGWVAYLKTESGVDAAIDQLHLMLDKSPSIKLLRMLSALLLESEQESGRSILIKVDRAINRIALPSVRYVCGHCGFAGTELHWHCPTCSFWQSIVPV
ncbi:lipopolysaccharide assembly protein LapB [Candidatus Methylospira mobilis]|uniref:Lipopolysaccharide assembly protein B n=1 Tax=Candidatus Methylospira mobilis TaxID=1808979 RepID=A0A5Q0BHI2_9GAMM|nr:lipopolysaccharide assembly protein LapB [Candidatus Methylospira mobilis]QFY42582.1 lipopolysaccharide assembly protein LapB [Candidatus Methylospira mobilis]WNV04304.1 lipopolysaccharide assembly protein LapB [Candidatus Methylospira mobilis]